MHYDKIRTEVRKLGMTMIPGMLMVCVRRAIRLGCFRDVDSMLKAIRTHAEDEISIIEREKDED